MCQCTSGNCGCSTIVLEEQIGPQGPSGSSSSVIYSNFTSVSTHSAGVETVMKSQVIPAAKHLMDNDQDKINIIAWFNGPSSDDYITFRLRQNTTAVVGGAQLLGSLVVNAKAYRIKVHLELTRTSITTYRIEGEIYLYGTQSLNTTNLVGIAPVFPTTITSPSNLTSDFYIFGTIQSTALSNAASMTHLCLESKKYLV